VKGDAIAGIIITGINIVGGLIIGVAMRGLEVGDAVKIYTILMGQNDDTGSFTGNPLVRRYPVNPKLLEQIAAMSGGSPYLATDTQALQTRFHQVLEELERSKLKDASIAKTPLAPYFLWPAFGFLALETLLRLTRFRKFP